MDDKKQKNHDIILQGNEISRAMYGCSVLAKKIIAFGSLQIREKEVNIAEAWGGKSNDYIPIAEFKISELLKALGFEKNGKNYLLVKSTIQELRTAGIEIHNDDDNYEAYNWFQKVKYNKQKDLVELWFTSPVGWALFNLKDGFSRMNIKTIGNFKSFYALRFYEIAISYMGNKGRNGNPKGCWFFEMTIEKIRETFKINENSYKDRLDNFIKKVISIPIDEINSINPSFEIEPLKIKKNRKTIGFRFNCTEKKEEYKIEKTDSRETKNEKDEINRFSNELEYYKMKYPEEFKKIFEEENKQTSFKGFSQIPEANTIQRLKEAGLK